jgi:serine/threonine protein kinase
VDSISPTASRKNSSSTQNSEDKSQFIPPSSRRVIARVSVHVLRLEREYNLSQQIKSQHKENAEHFVLPIELAKFPSRHGEPAVAISIFESPGENYLKELVSMGIPSTSSPPSETTQETEPSITLSQFMKFAIGAATCLEIIHHKLRTVHGEIRGDAFHFDRKTEQVKMINFGSGTRSFENGLTAAGWYSLTREAGVEHKIRYIAPEQTGRLPARPDGRTDIYSLGVLFWSILTVSLV